MLLLVMLAPVQVSAQSFDSGFEGDLAGWEVDSEVEPVAVVGTEGPDQYAIYAELGVEVAPNRGEFMARLRSPKTRNENQDRGISRISRIFSADSDTVAIALWLFSLDHRGDDILRISMTNNNTGQPVVSANAFPFNNGNLNTSCTTPCEEVIDTGKRRDVINTGWQVLSFTVDPGTEYTLSIELEAGQNESLGSWLYIDGVNLEPSAVINYNPPQPVEGDFVVFDCLDSVDPEGSDLSCIWAITAGGQETTLVGPSVVYWAPDSGSINVDLTVSDGEESASATLDPPLPVMEQDPRVNALNVEVLPGGSVDLVCRYADPGIGPDDTHSFVFNVPVDTVETVREADPALSSGITRATYQAAEDAEGVIPGTCTVGGVTDSFDITVLTPQDLVDRLGSNTSSTVGAPVVNADRSILGSLADPDSIAVYELVAPDGSGFRPGAEVVVTADFPVDYDIVVLSGSANPAAKPWASAPFVNAPFVNAPFVNVPFVNAPFVNAPFVDAPFVNAPFVNAPFVNAPFVNAPFVNAPFVNAPFVNDNQPLMQSLWLDPGFDFIHFPLSLLAGAPDGSNISGADVAPGDLGALSYGELANEQVFLKGLSAEFGTNPEQLLVEVGPGEDGLFLAVVPQAGSFATAPFSIQVEASIPRSTSELLVQACSKQPGDELVPAGKTSQTQVLRAGGSETLVVTQKQRLMATFGMDEDAWNAWFDNPDPELPDMMDFFIAVDATVISLPSDIFDQADLNPCDVQAQNALAESIKAIIDGACDGCDPYRTEQTKYVQLMGSIDIITAYYLPDETQTGNEILFSSDLLAEPATPLAAAISEGYMLTDAFYVDNDPQPFNGRELYLEDISVSRMVETPGEMLANAQRFVDSGGLINLVSTQSTGYDFFIDGTEVINNILTGNTFPVNNNTTRNDDLWDAAYLRCAFFGAGEQCSKPVSEFNAVNAHMSYNGALTAEGFNCLYLPLEEQPAGLDCSGATDPLGEVVRSTESAGIYDNPGGLLAINGITFSIGCHSGLSVPDAWALPEELGLPLNPARDWVQELGTWVGSWNFAYGDTDVADRGTEGLLPLVIANFAEGMSLGEALVQAKWQYGTGLFEFGVYDEKSLVGLGLFGMPQATLEGAAAAANAPAASAASTSSTPASVTGDTLTIDYIEETDETQFSGSINLHSNDKGVWYSIGDPPQAQAILGRPLLPVVKLFELRELDPTRTGTIHGVALRGGTYTTVLDQDPVFPAQTHDLITSIDEPQLCVDTLSPSLLASANRFDSPGGTLESVIVQPGQFQWTNGTGDPPDPYFVEGDFRIWNTMTLELMHPTELVFEGDQQPPEVLQQDLLGDPVSGTVTATLDATDASGIREIIALVYRDDDGLAGGTGTATEYPVTERNQEGVYELIIPDAFDNLLSFQYIDNAGNITAKTLKGALLRAIQVAIRTSIINLAGETQVVVEIGDFTSLLSPYMTIDFGDGSPPVIIEFDNPDPSVPFTLSLDDPEEGSATVVIPYDYSELELDSITISVEVRAAGALGTDEKTISTCSDPAGDVDIPEADIVGCSISSSGTNLTLSMMLEGPVEPDISYRLILPVNNTQIKYTAGAVTGPKKLKPAASDDGDRTVTFELDAARLPWDGISPLQFQFETQEGVSGGAGQGFVDTTDVKVYLP